MLKVKISFRDRCFETTSKVELIKDIRSYTGLGLKEAKDIVDAILNSWGYQTTIDHSVVSVGASEFFKFEVLTDVNSVQIPIVNKLMVQLKYSLDIAIEERNFDVARKLVEAIELL